MDIIRSLGRVLTGIGFMGARIILHKRTKIEGLTTAAMGRSAGAEILGVRMSVEVIAVVLAYPLCQHAIGEGERID